MARSGFDQSDLRDFQSANSYRAEIERDERDRRNRERADSLKHKDKDVQKITGSATGAIKRELKQEINKDDIGHEIREGYVGVDIAKNLIVGVALVVASCAVESAYNNTMIKAQEDSERRLREAAERERRSIEESQTQTLGQYKERIEETRQSLESTRQGYYVEYETKRTEVQQALEGAKQAYDKEKTALDREERRSDASYRKEMSSIDDGLKRAELDRDSRIRSTTENRDASISAANTRYESEVQRIKSEYSGADRTRELNAAVERRDNQISNATTVYANEIKRHNDEYGRQAEALNQQRDLAVARHTSEIQSIHDRAVTAETNYKNTVNHQNDIIRTEQIKYSEAVSAAKREHNNANLALDKYQMAQAEREGRFGGVEGIARAEAGRLNAATTDQSAARHLNAMHAEREISNTLNAIPLVGHTISQPVAHTVASVFDHVQTDSRLGRSAAYYAATVSASNLSLAEDLVRKFGTKEQVDLINKVSADIESAKTAKQNGQPVVKLATDDEVKRANQIVKSYAGDLTTEVGINNTVRSMKRAANELNADNVAVQVKIDQKTKALGDVNARVAIMEKAVKQNNDDQKALRTNKNADGTRLTQEGRKAIEARLQKTDVVGQAKELAALKNKKTVLTKDIGALQSRLGDNKVLINRITSHITTLSGKNGKAIADVLSPTNAITWAQVKEQGMIKVSERAAIGSARNGAKGGDSKKSNNMQKVGVRMIMNSVTTINKQLSRPLHSGDAIYKELNETKQTMAKIGKGYDNALAVSRISFKVLSAPGRMILSNTVKIMGKDGHLTRVGSLLNRMKIVNDKGKLTNGAARIMGVPGKILSAPGKILSAPMTWKRDLGKKALSGTMRLTRKTAGRVFGYGANVAGKGAQFVGKYANKGIRYAGGVARAGMAKTFGGVNRFVAKQPWYKSAASRANVLKERAKQMASRITSKLNLGPFVWLQKKLGGIIAAVGSAFAAIVSAITTAITAIIAGMLGLILLLFVIFLALGLIFSAIGGIVDWIASTTADHQSLIKNCQQYIVNQAVNYRNAELDILELFNLAHDDPSLIRVNNSPIYYALYDNEKHWFGYTGEKELHSKLEDGLGNQGAWELYNGLASERDNFKHKTNNYKKRFDSKLEQGYNSVSLKYYSGDQLTEDANGNYKLKPNAVASEYELSNAKDALAIVDTLFTNKYENMQRLEVLAYLGVGDYQATNNSSVICNNLFWASHRFIYNSGNSDEDIWYHVTEERVGNEDDYIINYRKKYDADGSATITLPSAVQCDNYETITSTYEEEETRTAYRHKSSYKTYNGGGYASGYGEYDASNAIKNGYFTVTSDGTNITPTQLYHYYQKDTPIALYLAATNYIYDLNDYHKDKYACSTLRFFATGNGNKYYVVDRYDNYMGTENFKSGSDQYEAITQVYKNGETYYLNRPDYFELDWNSYYGCYTFDVMSYKRINQYTDSDTVEKYLTAVPSFGGLTFSYPILRASKIVHSGDCTHSYLVTETVTKTVTFDVCRGHIDLDVAMAVSLVDDNNTLFKDAMKVDGLEEDTKADSILGLFTFDKNQDIFGLGTVTQKAFHPYEDWSENSGYREIARLKLDGDITYALPDDKNIRDLSIYIYHYDGKNGRKAIDSLARSPDGDLLYGMVFEDGAYFVPSFVSGEQKNVIGYEMQWTGVEWTAIEKVDLSIKIGRNGPYPYVVAARE